ncbi:MAG: 7-cyano-7-deazaguanine synthase [Treponema sp.]|nr:7-cyano-7-deazaguanine synthase [Treponema sp.]
MKIINNQTCVRCINDKTVKNISFDEHGICNFCREYEKIENQLKDYPALEKNFLNRIKNQGHRYDAAVGFSGGKDSTYVLYHLVKTYNLKVKAFTLDNGFMSKEAKDKIVAIVKELDIDHEFVEMDENLVKQMYNQICGKYLSPCLCCSFIGYAIMINYASKIDAAVMIHGRSPYQMLRNFSESDKDYFKPFITEGLSEQMENPEQLLKVIISKINLFVDKKLAESIKNIFLTDCYKKGFRPFLAYFLYHPYDKNQIIEFLEKNLNWVVESEEEHFDCLIHHGALHLKNTIARRSHLMPELSVMIRENKITREEAWKKAIESVNIDKKLAEEELKTFCRYAGLSYRAMWLKAKFFSKRWW